MPTVPDRAFIMYHVVTFRNWPTRPKIDVKKPPMPSTPPSSPAPAPIAATPPSLSPGAVGSRIGVSSLASTSEPGCERMTDRPSSSLAGPRLTSDSSVFTNSSWAEGSDSMSSSSRTAFRTAAF